MRAIKMSCPVCGSDRVGLGSVLVDLPDSVVIEFLCGSCGGQDVFTAVLREGQLFFQRAKGEDI